MNIIPGKWISCEEALPEDGERVLVAGIGLSSGPEAKEYIYSDTARFRKGYIPSSNLFIGAYGTITRWMRIPPLEAR